MAMMGFMMVVIFILIVLGIFLQGFIRGVSGQLSKNAEQAAKKGKSGAGSIVDTDGAGVRDLILEGRIDEAIDVYASFMGVDEFTARDAIEQMQREESAEYNLSVECMDEVQQLVANGRKIEAIKRYREMTQLGLKEAKDEIDRMECEGF